jgi:hypothetical protein
VKIDLVLLSPTGGHVFTRCSLCKLPVPDSHQLGEWTVCVPCWERAPIKEQKTRLGITDLELEITETRTLYIVMPISYFASMGGRQVTHTVSMPAPVELTRYYSRPKRIQDPPMYKHRG